MDGRGRSGITSLFIFATLLFVTFQPLLVPQSAEDAFLDDVRLDFTPENTTQLITIASHPNGVSSTLRAEVPAGEALTGIDLSLEPQLLPRNEIFTWTSSQVWNHSDATPELVNYNNTGLTLSGTDVGWDLNNNGQVPTGWTRTTSTYAMINSLACGRNGSGHSLNTRGGSAAWTSPTVDMSGLAQGQVSYWVRQGYSGCGEEPDSGENFYVQYRTTSNSWSTLRSFSGSTSGFNAQGASYTTTLPAGAFHSNFGLRFYQNAGSGTCCDYWFFDDVSLTQPGGQGNWTSPAFGWGSQATYSMFEGAYGLLSMDVERPGSSIFNWTVLDGTTLAPIAGYEQRTDSFADLGQIDWQRHQTLRIKFQMESGGGGVPVINSVNLNGRVVEEFQDDPSPLGWDMQGATWSSSGESVSGNSGDLLTSPYYNSTRPIVRVSTSYTLSGFGQLYIELNGDTLIPIGATSVQTLPEAGYSLRFIINGSGQWTLTSAQADLIPGDSPLAPRIDIGLDDISEWTLENPAIGPWGWQDRLANGYVSGDLTFSNGGSQSVMLWLPDTGLENFQWSIANVGGWASNSTWWRLKVGPTIIQDGNLGLFSGRATASISPDNLANLSDNLTQSVKVWSTTGVGFVLVEIEVGCESGVLRVGGISAPYSPIANMSFGAWDGLVQSINDEIPGSPFIDGNRVIPVPFITDMPASMLATITGIYSTSGLKTTSAQLINGTTTLTPSWQWFELHSLHETDVGMPGNVQVDFIGLNNRTTYEFPVDGSAVSTKGDSNLIKLHPDNPHSLTHDSNSVNSTIRFQLEPMWDDEESFEIRVRLVLVDGRRSVPEVATFGGGQSLGIENDIEITEISFINDLGVEIPTSASYLRGGSNVTISAEIGFHQIQGNLAPRSGDVRIEIFENDIEIHNSTTLDRGHFEYTFLVPPGSNDLTYRVEVTTLHGGWDYTSIENERTFQTDSLAPRIVASNIEHYDHRTHSPTQQLIFDVYDRPVLPQTLTLMLWREWLNDYDFDEWPDAEEYVPFTLTSPNNLSVTQANYTYLFDDNGGDYGDKVAGYITGSDPAGNPLLEGGTSAPDEHLFMYELALQGAPEIAGEEATIDGDRMTWLHPGNTYDLVIPFSEPNGYSDLDEIVLELASNAQSDNLEVRWLASDNRCTTDSLLVTIVDCDISAGNESISPYVDNMQLEVSFSLDWSLLSEGELRREPTLEIFDRSRQSSYVAMPHLRWRWSTDLHIPLDLISLNLADGVVTEEGAWASPGSNIQISGTTTFAESGQLPEFGQLVEFKLSGGEYIATSENGSFFLELSAPMQSGSHAMSWGLTNLPTYGNDVTNGQTALFWIVVDGESPRPVEVVTPRENSTIALEELAEIEIQLRLAETQEINPDSLRLNWLVTKGDDPKGELVAEGDVELIIPSATLASLQLNVNGKINLAEVLSPESLESQLSLHIWVIGSDAAGNPMASNRSFNSDDSPFTTWSIEQMVAAWRVEASDINYQRIFINAGESMVVQIDVNNIGTAAGSAHVIVEAVNLAGERKILQIANATAEPGQSETLAVTWEIEEMGIQWVEVIVADLDVVKGTEIDALKPPDEGILSGSLGGVDPIILVAFFALSGMLALVFLIFLRDSNSRRGKEWESEYWDEFEDEDYVDDVQEPSASSLANKAAEYDQIYSDTSDAVAAASAALQSTQSAPATPALETADPYGQAAVSPTAPAVAPGATTSAASIDADSDKSDWVQDANGHWWKKNEEGYWWRLGEDGQWHSADSTGY